MADMFGVRPSARVAVILTALLTFPLTAVTDEQPADNSGRLNGNTGQVAAQRWVLTPLNHHTESDLPLLGLTYCFVYLRLSSGQFIILCVNVYQTDVP
jgi:hypothetical protein